LCFAILKEKEMKKLALSIVLVALFASVASATVPGQDEEFQSGVKYYNSRNYETAVKHLQEYVGKKPDPTAYYLIGYSMYKLGNFSEADEYFSEAYFIDPEFSLEKVSFAKEPSEEILPKEPAAAKGTLAASETGILQLAAVERGPQPTGPLQEAFAEQKTKDAEPAQEPATTPTPEESPRQLTLVPQFIEPAAPSEEKKATDVEESALEEGTEYEEISEENGIPDPLEPWNRAMFTFNDKLYFWVAKPLARGYSAIVPEWGRVRVKNIFQNISMPVRFANNLLQLKIRGAGTELLRFVFNTTAGVGGMFDVAKNIDLKVHEEDLGQTLGVYGIGNGFYIVWPVLGFSSLRDTVGTMGDFYLEPVSYITPTEALIGVRTVDYTNETSLHIGDYEDMKESAIDPYISFRSAYIEYRKNKIKE
jgi:phospholipid-binding lipoprotein MlaA